MAKEKHLMSILDDIKTCVVRGHMDAEAKYPPDMKGQPGVKELIEQALEEGTPPQSLVKDGLIPGMELVGEKFTKGEYFVPEMLMSAKAMKSGLTRLRPLLIGDQEMKVGKVIIGTVQGDMHDIGKNLVGMMLEGAGFEVIDAGINVSPEKFVEEAKANPDAIVGMSALLTITMEKMKVTVESLRAGGLKNKVMIGGAPVTLEYAKEIGADGYAPDAAEAVHVARTLV
jgi:5-methyltetrahydrofolate--homocysteine methyltransferase